MSIKTFKRYEKKFLLTKQQYEALIPRLLDNMEPDPHCLDGKNYSIYNIYYDTVNSDVIRHSISKPYYKEELRLRSYRVPKSPKDKVFLELKKKINGIVNKRRVVLTLEEANLFIETVKENIDYILDGHGLEVIESKRNKLSERTYDKLLELFNEYKKFID